jgi:hypothetical protein
MHALFENQKLHYMFKYSDFHNDCLFLAQKKQTILVRNAENKVRNSALWLQNLNLNFFYRGKKRQSLWKSEYYSIYVHIRT